mgnify:CR=1 FL=1
MNLTTIINLNSEQQRQIALVSAAMIALLTLAYIGTDLYQSLLINQDHATTSTQPAKQKIATEFTDNSHLLFGQNPSTTSHTPLPSTKLQLILRGAFTANDPSNATAIIENADQTRSYRVGSLITGNTKLHAVHSERVVLSNNGKLETLYFPIADPVTGLTQHKDDSWTVHTDQGERQVTIVKVGRFMADVDTNHPFAGKTLHFDVEILDVRAATAEELDHGHAHGVGGHQH